MEGVYIVLVAHMATILYLLQAADHLVCSTLLHITPPSLAIAHRLDGYVASSLANNHS